jgi:1-acyl-sn-glycerol-3-phosphate acyltransferase
VVFNDGADIRGRDAAGEMLAGATRRARCSRARRGGRDARGPVHRAQAWPADRLSFVAAVAEPSARTAPEPELPPGLLGRATSEPGLTYHLLRFVWRVAAFAMRARLVLEGAEHLPRDPRGRVAGGWIAAVVPHRTWIDPFVPWILLPARPRFAFFGDARTMARSPLRRFVMQRLGGVMPIPARPDPRTIDLHLAAARQVLDAGANFMLMPEVGPPSEVGELRRIGGGLAYVALRNEVPIVPLVLGGNHELYLGRRIVLRVLAPLDPRELAGLARGDPLPEPGSSAERRAAHALTVAFAERVGPSLPEVHARAEPIPGVRKRGSFLTKLFR